MSIHSKGGSKSPYERYHLSGRSHDDASRAGTCTLDGLMGNKTFAENQRVDPPDSDHAIGEVGQWSEDDNYLYYCIEKDKWIRVRLGPMAVLGYLLTEQVEDLVVTDAHPYSFEHGDNSSGSLWEVEPTETDVPIGYV